MPDSAWGAWQARPYNRSAPRTDFNCHCTVDFMPEIIKDRCEGDGHRPLAVHRRIHRVGRGLIVLIALAGCLLVLSFLEFRLARIGQTKASRDELVVERGLGLRKVIDRLTPDSITPKVLLWFWARVQLRSQTIKAGVYPLEEHLVLPIILDRMAHGQGKPLLWQVREGQSLEQMRSLLATLPYVEHQSKAWSSSQLHQSLQERLGGDLSAGSLEGLFFPDTYHYVPGMSDLELLAQACQRQLKLLNTVWAQRPQSYPLRSPAELLVLASLVEKETGLADDRARVAAVFLNRLRLGMRLQSDPTVIYAMGSPEKRRLSRKDLQTDHPHNTYTRFGLPPTPIAIPGEAALLASIRPSEESSLYFVARGDGSSEFSETLAQHNRAVDRFIRQRGS